MSSLPEDRSEEFARHSDAKAYVFIPPESLPDSWRERGKEYVLVPLLPAETDAFFGGNDATSELSSDVEVLADLVLRGASIQNIARDLRITERSVQRRLGVLRAQFGVSSTAELAVLLAERGFKK